MDDVMVRERYELSKERLGVIMLEETVKEPYRDYFRKTAEFLLMLDEVQELVRNRDWESFCSQKIRKKEPDSGGRKR